MAKSQDWFQRYAVTDSLQGQTLTGEINQLRAIDINPVLPALSQSLALINQLAASQR